MNDIFAYAIIGIYFVSLLFIFIYSLTHLSLLINYLRYRDKKESSVFDLSATDNLPKVTVQLPVYNEKYVMKRLLKSVSEFDYPSEKIEIQVLDDSTDDSKQINYNLVELIKAKGVDIKHITRSKRKDFKAGALREGLDTAKGDFIAIFDADFLPQPSWIKNTIIHFKDPSIGVVQTRWGHLNRDFSTLTKSQAFALDTHFTLEQVGRNTKGYFINFNGTAGIWRKDCIIDAGNWQGDTLTEDLDLSYRAQLKGWKFKYLEGVETPAEVPVVISAVRSQQFRWNKGGAENFRKLAFTVLRNSNLSLKTKLHCIMHLLSSSMFLFILTLSLLSVPMLYIKHQFTKISWIFDSANVFIVSTVILFVCYWVPYKRFQGGGFEKFIDYIRLFFSFFVIALGFSLHNSWAVIQGYAGIKSDFIRTPKFNLGVNNSWKNNIYRMKKIPPIVFLEFLLLGYFAFGMYSATLLDDYGLFPFHFMLFLGYTYIVFKSVFTRV